MTPKRKKPPATRHGKTSKIELRGANVYVTLTRMNAGIERPMKPQKEVWT